jgi:hypothetical protein
VIRQDNDRVNRKRVPNSSVPKSRAQRINVLREQPKAAFGQVHGEEITAARDKVAAIARHGPDAMGFAIRSTHPTPRS